MIGRNAATGSYHGSANRSSEDELKQVNRMASSAKGSSYQKRGLSSFMSSKHRFNSENRILHISIIDYLQAWNCNKKMERVSKTVILGKDPHQLSAIEPNEYARRFRHFIESNVFI